MKFREQCLDDAMKCVCGDRDEQYGSPEDNFWIIAQYWNAYLKGQALKTPDNAVTILNSTDVANMMMLFKLGRLTTSPGDGTYDTYVDVAGYAACGAEITSCLSKKKSEYICEELK